MLEKYTDGIQKYDSIKKLTFDIANSGGYHRDVYRFKNGKQRERTLYSKKFDSVLVALWILHYKPLFIGKLSKRIDLIDYHVSIINRTFFIVMNCLNMDKVHSDDVMNRYVNLSLGCRIKEASKKEISKFYFGPYENGNFVQRDAVLNRALPLDESLEETSVFDNLDDVELELRFSLLKNRFGDRILNFLLDSDKQVTFKNIDLKIPMKNEELTEKSKEEIVEAINLIKRYMFDYVSGRKRFRPTTINSVTFSTEGR